MVSISRNLKEYTIEQLTETASQKTGALLTQWEQVGTANVAIFESTEKVTVDKIRKNITSYKGYTKKNTLTANTTRLTNTATKESYLITNIKSSLWNNLDLEKVEAF